MNASILMAVEHHGDSQLPENKYAAADARALAAAWEKLGCSAERCELLLDGAATKTAFESAIRRTLKKLTAEDVLFLYYAGSGFVRDDASYLTCHDSRSDDLEATSIELAPLLKKLAAATCGRIVVLLDATRGPLSADDLVHRDDAELAKALHDTERCLCFTACAGDELSHVAADLKRGIWAAALEQAFAGLDSAALEGQQLTISSLKHFLELSVAGALRKIAPGSRQTPGLISALPGETLLADLSEVIAERESGKHPQLGQIKDSILLAESSRSIRTLAGFSKAKKHALPERCDAYGRSFVVEITAEDLEEEISRMRAALKRAFGFTRLQLSAENTGDGAATITTPTFNYNVSVGQHESEPDAVVWRRSVDAITDPDRILSPEFEAVFGDVFSAVQLSLHGETDLDELIDGLEAIGDDEIRVDYAEDKHITSCSLRFKGLNAEVLVTRKSFTIIHPRAEKPARLLKSLFDVQTALTDRHQVRTIPFAALE